MSEIKTWQKRKHEGIYIGARLDRPDSDYMEDEIDELRARVAELEQTLGEQIAAADSAIHERIEKITKDHELMVKALEALSVCEALDISYNFLNTNELENQVSSAITELEERLKA